LIYCKRSGTVDPLKIIRIVLDVMSPAAQSMVDLAEKLNKIDGISQVDVTLQELEKNVEDLKVTLDGYGLDFEKIREIIKDFGAVIRNVDSITSAKHYAPNKGDDKLSASMLVLARHVDSKIGKIGEIYSEFDETLKHIQSKKT
jgi:hypothetical protein